MENIIIYLQLRLSRNENRRVALESILNSEFKPSVLHWSVELFI